MTLDNQRAFPEITITCRSRDRVFCFNAFCFHKLQEHFAKESGDANYNFLKQFDWELLDRMPYLGIFLWAGLATDADDHGERDWTIDKAMKEFSMLDLKAVLSVIEGGIDQIVKDPALKKNALTKLSKIKNKG